MKSYIFTTSNTPSFLVPSSIEALFENGDECFSVVLENDEELKVLMNLLGVQDLAEKPLPSSKDFSALFDYSGSQLPQLSAQDFDVFYEEWLRRSGRESNMDEYGQLVFLQGIAADWNKRSNRFVLREKA
jgi:hypothetical protein